MVGSASRRSTKAGIEENISRAKSMSRYMMKPEPLSSQARWMDLMPALFRGEKTPLDWYCLYQPDEKKWDAIVAEYENVK